MADDKPTAPQIFELGDDDELSAPQLCVPFAAAN